MIFEVSIKLEEFYRVWVNWVEKGSNE